MITAVDTNVLLDIFLADPEFGELSKRALKKCRAEGALCVCEAVWIESAILFSNNKDFLQTMQKLEIEYSSSDAKSASIAANAWRNYRKNGGKRERVAADFIIGSHAETYADRLLTRDKGFFKSYFKNLTVLDPTIT